MTRSRIRPVILSGGAGTRLWPLSTPARPKQFLALSGDRTMLQLTAQRIADSDRYAPPLVIAAEAHRETIERQFDAIGATPPRLILEPFGRGTAAAAALAALVAGPDELLLLMPSDHLIEEPGRLAAAVDAAIPAAQDGWLAAFGVATTRPETGYGYIRRGEEIAPGVHRAAQFVEKPNAEAAERMLAEGSHDWNAGIFLFRASAYLEQLRIHAPDILGVVEESLVGAEAGAAVRPDASVFERCRVESIDRAVMERADKIAVVPVEMSWSDIGSWDALFEASTRDEGDNSVSGAAAVIEGRGCLVRSDGPRVVAIGVENLIIVATGEAVLIVPRGESQRVREAVERLSDPGS